MQKINIHVTFFVVVVVLLIWRIFKKKTPINLLGAVIVLTCQ